MYVFCAAVGLLRMTPILSLLLSSLYYFSSGTSAENYTASSKYFSNSNSRASCRKQKIRHIKLQGIRLAVYFCTLMIGVIRSVYAVQWQRYGRPNKGKCI